MGCLAFSLLAVFPPEWGVCPGEMLPLSLPCLWWAPGGPLTTVLPLQGVPHELLVGFQLFSHGKESSSLLGVLWSPGICTLQGLGSSEVPGDPQLSSAPWAQPAPEAAGAAWLRCRGRGGESQPARLVGLPAGRDLPRGAPGTALPCQPGRATAARRVPCPRAARTGAAGGCGWPQLGPGCSEPRQGTRVQVGSLSPRPGSLAMNVTGGVLKPNSLCLRSVPFQLLFQELKCPNPRSDASGNPRRWVTLRASWGCKSRVQLSLFSFFPAFPIPQRVNRACAGSITPRGMDAGAAWGISL